MRQADEATYREYVQSRMTSLRRTAFLLCGDWHTADDVVSVALTKLLRHWPQVSRNGQPDAYVRKILLRVTIDERRRPWRRESVTADPPDRAIRAADPTDRMAALAELAALPPRRRAVLVLRFFCDLSVEETAEVLNCSPGTVKSQTARALESLRERLVPTSTVKD